MKDFLGFHSEWNLGSPGGWEYQRITQELGKRFWSLVRERVKIEAPISFDHPLFNPVVGFARTLMQAHERNFGSQSPHILLTAEPDTLETVVENKNFVNYLNTLDGTTAALADPREIETKGEEILHLGKRATVIFQDFNTDVLLDMEKEFGRFDGLRAAIAKGLVVNPKGMEPVGIKSVFEAVSGRLADSLHHSTVRRTPWTRMLAERSCTGPDGEYIPDFPAWAVRNIHRLVLKPVQGYSGKGVIVGYTSDDPHRDVERSLAQGDYIAQELVPLHLWGEDSPWLKENGQEVFLKRWQTDFRCLVTAEGVIGFLCRFGGVPTNVGSGGGTQPLAFLPGEDPTGEAVKEINGAILSIPHRELSAIKEEVDELAVHMGNTYLLGPIPLALRPRIVNETQISALMRYGQNLWQDCVKLTDIWRRGGLEDVTRVSPEDKEIMDTAPWRGEPAMMAADGLFSFGGHPDEFGQPAGEQKGKLTRESL